jgi:transcriptional regulator with XRE-family HTH domain
MPRTRLTPDSLPAAVTGAVATLGRHIAAARRRRGWTQAMLAARAGIPVTLAGRVERGEPGTGIAAFVAALWALGLLNELDAVASDAVDREGAVLAAQRLGVRVRRPGVIDNNF